MKYQNIMQYYCIFPFNQMNLAEAICNIVYQIIIHVWEGKAKLQVNSKHKSCTFHYSGAKMTRHWTRIIIVVHTSIVYTTSAYCTTVVSCTK